MGTLFAASSPFCRPEEDPSLLLESTLSSMEEILRCSRGLPLRLTWIEQPYGEDHITILEEEVIPAIQQGLSRVDELDQRLAAEQELLQRCQLQAKTEALADLRPQMAWSWMDRSGPPQLRPLFGSPWTQRR
jgi:hypothetical protein